MYIEKITFYRGVAQLGRALGSGLRGRGFESRRPDDLFRCRKSFSRFAAFFIMNFIKESSKETPSESSSKGVFF